MSRPPLTREILNMRLLAGRRTRTRQVVLLRLAGRSPSEIAKQTCLRLWRVRAMLRWSGGQTVGCGKLATFFITGHDLTRLGCGVAAIMATGATPWICGTDLFGSRPLKQADVVARD